MTWFVAPIGARLVDGMQVPLLHHKELNVGFRGDRVARGEDALLLCQGAGQPGKSSARSQTSSSPPASTMAAYFEPV